MKELELASKGQHQKRHQFTTKKEGVGQRNIGKGKPVNPNAFAPGNKVT